MRDSHKHSAVGSDSLFSNHKPSILTAFVFPPHHARPKSGLFMQPSHPDYIHMNSKHGPELAVSPRCPNRFPC